MFSNSESLSHDPYAQSPSMTSMTSLGTYVVLLMHHCLNSAHNNEMCAFPKTLALSSIACCILKCEVL